MSVANDLLLHPELLSNDQLRAVIIERQLKLPALEQTSRDNLLEVFHQYCVPYAQRRYRDSGRGKLLNHNRGCTADSPNKSPERLNKTDTANYREMSKSFCKDRLLPPPDHLSREIKRIKLNNGAQKINHNLITEFSVKRKIEYNKETLTQMNGVAPEKKARKSITWP